MTNLTNIFGQTGLTILSFLVALVPLLVLHEFGHFLMAKWAGVWAHEFGIGIPPRLVRLFRWRETEFTLNLIPFGAFVRLEGEDAGGKSTVPAETDDFYPNDAFTQAEAEAERQRHSLYAQPAGKRFLIFFGGPLMNLLTAWVVAVILFSSGIPAVRVTIDEVAPDSPAAQAGLQSQDVIVAIGGQPVQAADDVTNYTQDHLDQPVSLTVERNGETLPVTLTPRSQPPAGQGPMGIVLSGQIIPGQQKRYSLPQAFVRGTEYFAMVTLSTVMAPVYIMRGLIPVEEARPVGVIGISRIASQSVQQSVAYGSLYPILNILIVVSVGLAIFNLLPIPALDGGRILFVIVEKLRRKPITPAIEERIHQVALMLFLVLFVAITALDILFPINLPTP